MSTPDDTPGNTPPWFDPAMPGRENSVLACLLERHARERPDQIFVRFDDGIEWTYDRLWREVRASAAALQALGVERGDRVLAWLPNGEPLLRTWFAVNLLGAALMPVNTAYRGRLLEHVLALSGARLLVTRGELLERLEEVDTATLDTVICTGGQPANTQHGRWRLLGPDALVAAAGAAPQTPTMQPWDLQLIVLTSGTTGPSKAVMIPYAQCATTGCVSYGYMTPADRCLINLPMFHVGGLTAIYGALIRGASVALTEGFRASAFWDQIRVSGATTLAGLLGGMVTFLAKAEPRQDEADNPLRMVCLTPVNATTEALAKRYSFDYFTGFNMTELSVPLVSTLNTRAHMSCGRPRSGVECRLVDEHDLPVADDTVGELVVRTEHPWTLNSGYLGDAEATAQAWRNGWFHTGDLMRRDAAGNHYFVDRRKDAIRRRGENISSLEVELEVAAHPDVVEAAAVGVPGDYGDEEVLVVVVMREGVTPDPESLVRTLIPRLPHFMVPRYLRFMDVLPRTPTNKVQKSLFREQGCTADTWDREAAGLRLAGERFGDSR